ncbi:MAG: polysaccharide biosynthesis tyrosine autokinase, partial [Campylobacterales bacterium]
AGIALTVLRELLDNTVKSKEDIERLSAVPMYGVVPVQKGKKFGSAFLEAFRALRTNLEFMQVDKKYKSIVVTSTVSGEGKTTVAANLAVVLAKGGKKVVVVDLDMRRAKLSHYFGLKNERGISTLLSKKHTLDEVIQPVEDKGVDIIAAGPIPPNPSELIMSEYAEEIMERLHEWYDYVILDTPPVGLVTDAAILMHRADVSLLVVKYGYSKKEFVQSLDQLVRDHKIKHVGIVFNGVDIEKNYGYGYGYGYKYGGSDYYS